MFLIRKKSKNSSVPGPAPTPPAMASSKHSKSFGRSARSVHQPAESPSPVLSGYQSSPEDTKSYHSFAQPFSERTRSPLPPLPTARGVPQIPRTGPRKNRQMPTFNMMILGAKATGKTTFLHTLLGTLVPSLPTVSQSAPIEIGPTHQLLEKQMGVVSLSGEKVTLNVIDTPGLDIHSNDEFRVDLQMNEALRYIENKFDESLHVERQVHRNPTRLGDSHVHIAIYFIDPSTISRRRRPSASICSHHERELTKGSVGTDDEHMSGVDLRQLKRLSRRANILPVIGRADELTEAELLKAKDIIRQDIRRYGIELGLFEHKETESGAEEESENSEPPEVTTASSTSSKSNEEHQERKKPPRRKSMSLPSVRRRRSSVIGFLHQELEKLPVMVPLSVIGAEIVPGKPLEGAELDQLNEANPFVGQPGGNQPASIYVRRFKWATVDVLNPNHCEFILLRAVLLGSHLVKLKEATRLEKYEKYRTEKLLARRVTINKGPIGLEEQRKIAMELEQIEIPHIENPGSIFGGPSSSMRPVSSASGQVVRSNGIPKRYTSARAQGAPQYGYQASGSASEDYYYHSHPHSQHHEDSYARPMVF